MARNRHFRPDCPVCQADPERQPDCRDCAGTGLLRNVAYCQDPWNELIHNLWLGGHDYSPDGAWLGEEAPKITSGQFHTVISFYQRPDSKRTVPAYDVAHHYYRMPDGVLTDADLREVYRLSKVAIEVLDRPAAVLLRCQAGLNRSSLCAAYVLMQVGFDPETAIRHIRKQRSPYALCNEDFVDYIMRGLPND